MATLFFFLHIRAKDKGSAAKNLRKETIRQNLPHFPERIASSVKGCKKRNSKYFAMCAIGEGSVDLRGLWDLVTPEQKQFTVNLETWKPDGDPFSLEEYRVICDRVRNW